MPSETPVLARRTKWLTVGVLTFVVILAFVIFAGSGLGWFSGPHELDVQFKPGTSVSEATAAFDSCRHFSEVVRVSGPKVDETGLLTGRMWTRDILRSDKTQPLLTCLEQQSSVRVAAWPD